MNTKNFKSRDTKTTLLLNVILIWRLLLMPIRSYYKCTNPRCSAKKQVEKSNEEPDTLIVTYEGLHLHFVYPFSLVPDKTVPTKKFKKIHLNSQIEAYKDESQKNLGLLEDMVPLIVRHPSNTTSSSYSSSSSSSSSSSISPSSLTCSFNSAPSHFYLCINTTISWICTCYIFKPYCLLYIYICKINNNLSIIYILFIYIILLSIST